MTKNCLPVHGPAPRRVSARVKIGHVEMGGSAPIVVQSMTNTDTADIQGTVDQVAALARAGDRKSTRLNSSHVALSRMPSSA